MPSCTLIWFLCKSFQKKIFYVNGYLNNLHRFVLLCFFFHSRHVLGVKDIYCAFDYGLFYVPKHSFIVPLFLHVVNRLYILSSAFCCWSVVHRESATRFKNFAAISVYSFPWSLMALSTTFVTKSSLCSCLWN